MWTTTDGSLPAVGEDVLVYRRDGIEDSLAIAHIDETDDGEAYWYSDSDVFHGQKIEYATHWQPLPPLPPSVNPR